MSKETKIPAALAIAFSTRRAEFIGMYFSEVHTKLADGTLLPEEMNLILNALEKIALELWDAHTALTTLDHIAEDIRHQVRGVDSLIDQFTMLSKDASAGTPMPAKDPEGVRDHYRAALRDA